MTRINNEKGFTFLELLIVIGISSIMFVATIPVYGNWQVSSQLNEISAQTIQLLRQARVYSIARKNDSAYGVFFEENLGDNDRIIFYQGDSYASRDSDYDQVTILNNSLELDAVIVSNDINFSKAFGVPSSIGTITISANSLGSKIINVNLLGMIEEN